ncbi:MAG: hypothetical protein ACRCZF_12870 [Gemmataceae bacterium]
MRRIVAMASVFGVLAVAVGCQHVGGVCDCTHHPDNAVLPTGGNPYATVGQPVTGVAVPEKLPATPGK